MKIPPRKEPLLIRGDCPLQTEMCWRVTVRAGSLANKLRKPAVEMVAVAVLCFPMKSLHKRHAEFPFKLPREDYRSSCYDSTRQSQKYEDKLRILRSLNFPFGVDGCSLDPFYVPHLAVTETHHPSNPRPSCSRPSAGAGEEMGLHS